MLEDCLLCALARNYKMPYRHINSFHTLFGHTYYRGQCRLSENWEKLILHSLEINWTGPPCMTLMLDKRSPRGWHDEHACKFSLYGVQAEEIVSSLTTWVEYSQRPKLNPTPSACKLILHSMLEYTIILTWKNRFQSTRVHSLLRCGFKVLSRLGCCRDGETSGNWRYWSSAPWCTFRFRHKKDIIGKSVDERPQIRGLDDSLTKAPWAPCSFRHKTFSSRQSSKLI